MAAAVLKERKEDECLALHRDECESLPFAGYPQPVYRDGEAQQLKRKRGRDRETGSEAVKHCSFFLVFYKNLHFLRAKQETY